MEPFNGVKVFSATKAADREVLGEKVTAWVRANPERRVVSASISQSSDASFHCLSIIVFFWHEVATA
jgi:hypothetical protein